mmetsp:Transcript_24105/g.43095  ORF Transcript_24105/g.43095 Transcript_24105/m.43095 type:complete len:318 (-) Transcript_24105:321-1274(-)
MDGGRPNGAAHDESRSGVGAASGLHGWTRSRQKFATRVLLALLAYGLHPERVAAGALPDVGLLGGGGLFAGAGGGVDADEYADVEVDGQREQRNDVALVAIGMRLDASEEDAEGHFMAVGAVDGVATVVVVAGRAVVATEIGHVRGRDQQQAALRHRLYGGVQEVGGSAVRIQVHGVVRDGVAHHEDAGVEVLGEDLVLGGAAIQLDVAEHGGGGGVIQIVRVDAADGGDFEGVADRAETGGGEALEDTGALAAAGLGIGGGRGRGIVGIFSGSCLLGLALLLLDALTLLLLGLLKVNIVVVVELQFLLLNFLGAKG